MTGVRPGFISSAPARFSSAVHRPRKNLSLELFKDPQSTRASLEGYVSSSACSSTGRFRP
jgi:hypothetical protein